MRLVSLLTLYDVFNRFQRNNVILFVQGSQNGETVQTFREIHIGLKTKNVFCVFVKAIQ